MISRKHWSPGSDVSVQSVERRDSGGWTVSGSLTPNVALQLHVSSKVCLPCCGLMSPSPHRPSDNISRFNLTLGQPIGDASDLLN